MCPLDIYHSGHLSCVFWDIYHRTVYSVGKAKYSVKVSWTASQLFIRITHGGSSSAYLNTFPGSCTFSLPISPLPLSSTLTISRYILKRPQQLNQRKLDTWPYAPTTIWFTVPVSQKAPQGSRTVVDTSVSEPHSELCLKVSAPVGQTKNTSWTKILTEAMLAACRRLSKLFRVTITNEIRTTSRRTKRHICEMQEIFIAAL